MKDDVSLPQSTISALCTCLLFRTIFCIFHTVLHLPDVLFFITLMENILDVS